jgi:hypothetical protein
VAGRRLLAGFIAVLAIICVRSRLIFPHGRHSSVVMTQERPPRTTTHLRLGQTRTGPRYRFNVIYGA